MTASAVRSWLASTVAPVGIAVYDEPLVIAPAGDFVMFSRFPGRKSPLTFGRVGSLQETTYTPSMLFVLANPSNDAHPAHTLDGYVELVCDLLRKAATPVTINDALTGEASQLVLVGDMQIDPAPANTLTATVVVVTLTEYATEAA